MSEEKSLFSRLLKGFSKQQGLDELLAMCDHWNGYKRENAVKSLGVLGNPLAIPQLIIRANDWVPQVRSAASRSIAKLLTRPNAEAFVYCLPELYHLKTCRRANHNNLITQITEYLLVEENTHHIVNAINHENPKVARLCVSLTVEYNLVDEEKLVQSYLAHPDIIVRTKISSLLRKLNSAALNNALDIVINDPFMPIRREAFQIILKKDNDHSLAEKMLYDRHSSIREIAVKYLKELGIDVISTYKKELDSNNPHAIRCALWGMAYLNSVENIISIRCFLRNDYPSVRKQAINTLTKLDDGNIRELLIQGLTDESPGVCKEAARLTSKQNLTFSAENLFEIIDASNHSHTVASCFGIAKRINKWERLIFLIGLFEEKYLCRTDGVAQIEAGIKQWDAHFDRSASQPSKMQLAELSQKCKTFGLMLRPGEYQSIRFTLKSFGIEL